MDIKLFLTSRKKVNYKTMIICAHYDDETISMGSRFQFLGTIYFVHTTNSSPSNLNDAFRNGFDNELDYGKQRKSEFINALSLSGINNYICHQSGIPDQESSFNIKFLTHFLAVLINKINPDIIFTHPYEGGHPDHDTTSFIVNKVCRGTGFENIYEFSSYHSNQGRLNCSNFLNPDTPITEILLSENERRLKKAMLKKFETQKEMIQYFSPDKEIFRKAPAYNYAEPPHEGKLFYEQFDWGIKGDKWRELAYESS